MGLGRGRGRGHREPNRKTESDWNGITVDPGRNKINRSYAVYGGGIAQGMKGFDHLDIPHAPVGLDQKLEF